MKNAYRPKPSRSRRSRRSPQNQDPGNSGGEYSYKIAVLHRPGEPAATAIHHATLMCFLPGIRREVVSDIARQYASDHGLDVLDHLMPSRLLTAADHLAIGRAFAADPELGCVVHQYGPPPEVN